MQIIGPRNQRNYNSDTSKLELEAQCGQVGWMLRPLIQVNRVNGVESINPAPVQDKRPLKITLHPAGLARRPQTRRWLRCLG